MRNDRKRGPIDFHLVSHTSCGLNRAMWLLCEIRQLTTPDVIRVALARPTALQHFSRSTSTKHTLTLWRKARHRSLPNHGERRDQSYYKSRQYHEPCQVQNHKSLRIMNHEYLRVRRVNNKIPNKRRNSQAYIGIDQPENRHADYSDFR